jgi:hypothetical protein
MLPHYQVEISMGNCYQQTSLNVPKLNISKGFLNEHSCVYVKELNFVEGRTVAQAVSRRFAPAAARVWAQVGSCGIYGRHSDTGAGFLEYFGLFCQFSFHRLLHTHHLSSGAATIGQLVADVRSGLSLTPPQETKKNLRRTIIYYFYPYDFFPRRSCLQQ